MLLGNEYRNMRLGHEGAKVKYDSKLEELGLRLDGSISKERAGEHGDTYFVKWPFDSSQNRFIDLHVRSKSNTRDPKRCLAIYFFWDDESRQVIVCSLPGHLTNRLSVMSDSRYNMPRSDEDATSKLPALKLLMAMGWEYLPPGEANALRWDRRGRGVVVRRARRVAAGE